MEKLKALWDAGKELISYAKEVFFSPASVKSHATSGTVSGVGAVACGGWQQMLLFGIALVTVVIRLVYDSIRLYRLWKNKKAVE